MTTRLPALNDEKKRFKVPKIKKNRYYSKQIVSDNEEMPSLEVMKRLEAELGSFASQVERVKEWRKVEMFVYICNFTPQMLILHRYSRACAT